MKTKTVILIVLAALVVLSYLLPEALQSELQDEWFNFTLGRYELSLYRISQSLLIIIVAFWAIRLLLRQIESVLVRRNVFRSSSRLLLIRLVQGVLYFVLFMIILSNLGIDLTALAIFSGTIGIGLGFGLQKIASNFISGIILSSENAINEGDLLELTDGTLGFVRKIGARHILLEGLDSKEFMVPNEEFINNRVVNWTYSDQQARIDIPFGVAYGTNLRRVREIVLEIAGQHERGSQSTPPGCFVTGFGDSSIDFILYFWLSDVTKGIAPVRGDIYLSMWEAFEREGITIPFPQRDVHMIPVSGQIGSEQSGQTGEHDQTDTKKPS